jgi:glutaredoxin 2
MKLYHYDHCPYCVKARMIFGLKGVAVTLHALLNDDEATPIRMIGVKQVPILERGDGSFMPESMDIVRYVDGLDGNPCLRGAPNPAIATWLAGVRDYIYKLAMPRWVEAPLEEFATPSARAYFTHKKEAMIGDFGEQRARSTEYIARANADMAALAPLITSPEAVNGTLSEDDIHLFAALRAFSIMRGITYPTAVEAYRQTMATRADVPLHDTR